MNMKCELDRRLTDLIDKLLDKEVVDSNDILLRYLLCEINDIKDEILELQDLREEVQKLKEETSRNRQAIHNLKDRRESYGNEIKIRVESMIKLIEDYGGAMASPSIKGIMGLSKDEFYRTLRFARKNNCIEVLTNPKDRRSHILKLRANSDQSTK
jgi:hypothetical protein